MMKTVDSIFCALIAAALAATPLDAGIYTVSVPHYHSNPGATLSVPVSLDNATGLAQLRLQLNYDAKVLTLTHIAPGPLGAQFDMSHEDIDGSTTLDFVRATALAGGSGRLAMLEFHVNSGATTDLYSDLAVAQFEIGDDSGVSNFAVTHILKVVNGSVSVSLSTEIDNESNGLPDWWETSNGLDLFASAVDEDDDGDSLNNLLEYAFGGNPKAPDVAKIAPAGKVRQSGGHSWLDLTFRRRKGAASLSYVLLESPDMKDWDPVDPGDRQVGPTVDLGDGMESVTVRCPYPLNAPDSPAKWFMSISVEPVR